MTNEIDRDFHVIEGRLISEHVPEDVPALQIIRRRSVSPAVRICAVGDIGLSGRAAKTMVRRGADALLSDIAPLLRAANISFGNLESSLGGEIEPQTLFAGSISGAETLRKAGFNMLHLANNHVADCGQRGLHATLCAVRENDMIPLGVGNDLASAKQLIKVDINGLRIGWLGCGRTLLTQPAVGPRYWEFDEEQLLSSVKQVRGDVDLLIVSIHLGQMYMDYPRPQDKVMAERLMNSGGTVILMHHAHVLQGIEVTSSATVSCYNLGNFLWDWEEGNIKNTVMLREQNEGAVFVFDLDKNGVSMAAAIPTWIDEECCVRWAAHNQGNQILHRLKRISLDLRGNFASDYAHQRASRNTGQIFRLLAFHARHGNWNYVYQSLRRIRWEHLGMIGRWLTTRGRE